MWKSLPLEIHKFAKVRHDFLLRYSRKLNVNQSQNQNVEKTKAKPFRSSDGRNFDNFTWKVPLRLRINEKFEDHMPPRDRIVNPNIPKATPFSSSNGKNFDNFTWKVPQRVRVNKKFGDDMPPSDRIVDPNIPKVKPFSSSDRRNVDNFTWNVPLFVRVNKRFDDDEMSPSDQIVDPNIPKRRKRAKYLPNEVVDKIIDHFKSYITEKDKWRLNLSDFKFPFNKTILGFIPVSGYVNLRNGQVKDFRRLRRLGDFKIKTKDDHYFTFSGTVEIPNLVAVFPDYDLNFLGLNISGRIEAQIKTSRVILRVDTILDYNSEFSFSVLNVQREVITKDMKISASGLTVALDWLQSVIVTSIANRYSKEISKLIDKEIDRIVRQLSYGP